ncbi:FkbM family methyltransferase [Patescibacteria group bacterium]|nr:FkbM family methyltransferase [Patescibacteria group bacterium]
MINNLMDIIDPTLPFAFINRLYKTNFALYKNLYFLYKRFNEREEIEFIKKVIKPGMIVLDIGANIGFFTLILSDLVGRKGKVYAFEPEKNNFRNLKRLCGRLKNVKLNNLAVGKKNGTINLYVSNTLNVDHLTYNNGEKRKIVPTRVIAIDKYFDGHQIDFIKIDTQGFEYEVLLGMAKILKGTKKLILLSEFSFFYLRRAGASARNFLKLLKSSGFKISYLEEDYKNRLYGKNQGKMSYVNLIATKGY